MIINGSEHMFDYPLTKINIRSIIILSIKKTNPQTVLAHHRVGLHTYTQIRDQNGREFEA